MKAFIVLLITLLSVGTFAYDSDDVSNAESLAEKGIIVSAPTDRDYRLDDYILRQEVVGIALKVAGVNLPSSYSCKGYFGDATFTSSQHDSWVCRAFELAADRGFVSKREDLPDGFRTTRPRALITRSEALAILMAANNLRTRDFVNATDSGLHDWQNNLIQTALSDGFIENIYGDVAQAAKYFGANKPATRAEVFGYALAIDGDGPKACIQLGKYSGGGYVYPPEDPADFVCCSGLTSVPHPEGDRIADIGNICAKIGDGVCDAKYESKYNSKDCRKTISYEGCTSYFDGCNNCTGVSGGAFACTKKYCGGVHKDPYCTACEDGYKLEDGECKKPGASACIQIGKYAGGGYVANPENPADFVCCDGLTKVPFKDSFMIPDAGSTCAKIGDGYCDPKYENNTNSIDCKEEVDLAGCRSYFDGCNNCYTERTTGNVVCTELACFVNQPKYCISCKDGYEQDGYHCRKKEEPKECVKFGQYAGGKYSKYGPYNPDEYVCCAGLTKAPRINGHIVPELGDVCLKIGDGVCDRNSENNFNSIDCKDVVDFQGCKNYYDGCNSCTFDEASGSHACTKRACFQKTGAYCSACLDGYRLDGIKCVSRSTNEIFGCQRYSFKCIQYDRASIGGKSIPNCDYKQNEHFECQSCREGFTLSGTKCLPQANRCLHETEDATAAGSRCCPGSQRVESIKDANRFICANVGDGKCNKVYENNKNSHDCTQDVDTSGCLAYEKNLSGGVYCTACKSGYRLAGIECRKVLACVKEGGYAGGAYGPYHDPDDYVCCDGLVKSHNGYTDDAGSTCIKQGDGYCNSEYEHIGNSTDCRPLKNCSKYFDGCNTCSVSNGQLGACTKKYCSDATRKKGYCMACEDEYELKDGVCKLKIYPSDPFPGPGCEAYFDGCNGCHQDDNGNSMCTAAYCEPDQLRPAYCTTCKDGYELKDKACVPKSGTTMSPNYDLSVCTSYYDGCNTCLITDGKTSGCTKKACVWSERPYCKDFSYTPSDMTSDSKKLSAIENNIRQYAKDLSCTQDSQCVAAAMGHKSCGGPAFYLLYSKYTGHGSPVNPDALSAQSKRYSELSEAFDKKYGLVSNCMFINPPNTVACENGKCVAY